MKLSTNQFKREIYTIFLFISNCKIIIDKKSTAHLKLKINTRYLHLSLSEKPGWINGGQLGPKATGASPFSLTEVVSRTLKSNVKQILINWVQNEQEVNDGQDLPHSGEQRWESSV